MQTRSGSVLELRVSTRAPLGATQLWAPAQCICLSADLGACARRARLRALSRCSIARSTWLCTQPLLTALDTPTRSLTHPQHACKHSHYSLTRNMLLLVVAAYCAGRGAGEDGGGAQGSHGRSAGACSGSALFCSRPGRSGKEVQLPPLLLPSAPAASVYACVCACACSSTLKHSPGRCAKVLHTRCTAIHCRGRCHVHAARPHHDVSCRSGPATASCHFPLLCDPLLCNPPFSHH